MRKLILILFAGLSVFLCNCKKETAAKVITETDTVFVVVHDTTVIPALISDTTTTFIVMRHAEKESTGTDPDLNSDGILRAEELKRVLSSISINAIYTTAYKRTRQTVEPLAIAKGITITEYQASMPYTQLVNELVTANRGKVVVIVGHSNTVPGLLNELSNQSFNITIGDNQYDHLFIVSLPEQLSPTVTSLKYGKITL